MEARSRQRSQWAVVVILSGCAVAMLGASSAPADQQDPPARTATGRASITLRPGSIRAADIGTHQILPRHFGLSTMQQIIGAGPAFQRPRATRATAGWLYFASDIDGGALFRSDGRTWTQLTPGRLGGIARNSIDSSRIAPGGIAASRLADDAVTARSMSMDAWRAITGSGPIARRPVATTRPAGAFYFATDVQGGTLYQSDGTTWLRISSLGAEPNISANSITSAEIAPASVTATELAANAVTSVQLAPSAVGTPELADGSVTLAKIAPAVWDDRLAAGTIAARPAADASNASSLYFASDDAGGTLSRSDGSSWTPVGRAVTPRAVSMYVGTWTNQPAALTELMGNGRGRMRMDLASATEARFSANVAVVGTNASTSLCVQYSADNGATWANFDDSAGSTCASGVLQVSLNPTGFKEAAWTTIPAAARAANTLLRFVGIAGNGTSDPQLGLVSFEAR